MERSPSVQLRRKFKALPGDGADLGISSSYPRPQIARPCYLFWCLRFRNCLEIRADRMARKWEFFLRSAACVTSHLMPTQYHVSMRPGSDEKTGPDRSTKRDRKSTRLNSSHTVSSYAV